MLRRSLAGWLLLAVVLLLPYAHALAQTGATADALPASFHRDRREALRRALPRGAVAVLFSAPERMRTGDTEYEYRQNSDLYYLTGSIEAGTVLVVAPDGFDFDGRRHTELLLVPPRVPAAEQWLGERLGPERARTLLGLDAVVSTERFDDLLAALKAVPGTLHHLPYPACADPGTTAGDQVARFSRALNSRRHDDTTLRRVLDDLRSVKTPDEVALMRRAIDVTVEAQTEAIRAIAPGMHEYEVEALIEYGFARRGAEAPAFPSIVGSGPNSTTLHYSANRRRMEPSDLVLMDVGAELHGYAADVTRTVPVDGTFSPEQKALYEIVLRANEAATAAARPGTSISDLDGAALRVVADGLRRLGLISRPEEVLRFLPHGVSHHLGLDVHDVGGERLRPGAVVTIEPGVYIRPTDGIDPRWWNIGIRIEDDVLVTPSVPEVLTRRAPRTVAEIEALMRGAEASRP